MAVNRELQLQDSQQESASKDREICTLQFELSKLQEQVWHSDRNIFVFEGLGNVFC